MRILADRHHQSLWKSLEMLFEGRLGWELYTMIGLEWFEQGYWKLAEPYQNNIGTIGQYLGARGASPDSRGVYLVDGIKGISLEGFKQMDFDVVLVSVPEHLQPYTDLIRKFKPKAKLIFQIGNHFGDIDFSLAKNIMSSTHPHEVPGNVNAVFYHQEFDLHTFKCTPPDPELKYIRSFVNILPVASHFAPDWQDFLMLERMLPEFKFESYGASCRDGCIQTEEGIARLMAESLFGVNFKTGGDGYGHIVHNWAFCGRPLIVKGSQYAGKLGGMIMKDGVTCIDVEKLPPEQARDKLMHYSEPERHRAMCEAMYNIARQTCDFDKEELQIRKFLERLI